MMKDQSKSDAMSGSVSAPDLPCTVLVQTAIGDYRQAVLESMEAAMHGRLTILAGPEYFDPAVKTRVRFKSGILRPAQNVFLLGRKLLFQRGVIAPAVRADVAILELNPRILSVWLTLFARRLRGKASVLWGHATSRRGRKPVSAALRTAMWSLGRVALVYTETERLRVLDEVDGRGVKVIVAPNSLYVQSDMWTDSLDAHGFLYVGRLSPDKDPELVLRAFHLAAPNLGVDARLRIVGDGPLRNRLEKLAEQMNGEIEFCGHVSDAATLRKYYGEALATVSPGYVGLSIIQSISFGTPMVYAGYAPHAPEIEAAVEGTTAIAFQERTPESLSDALIRMSDNRQFWLDRKSQITQLARERYSVEKMAAGLMESILACHSSLIRK